MRSTLGELFNRIQQSRIGARRACRVDYPPILEEKENETRISNLYLFAARIY